MNIKDFNIDLSSLDVLGKALTDIPNILMSQLSEDEKREVNKLVDVDKTDLVAMGNLIKDLKNKQDGSRG